jgi:DNA invertase Pin-like site-specific DNA recombinase
LKKYFAYTRVSTVKQGEHGVSLQEQKAEIERYSSQKGLQIVEWFEGRETAAKLGRRVFADMMRRLRAGDADGLVIHKIDRSARNLKDWADIAQLADEGIEIHFIREGVDLRSSSGRLSADVQAVVAANYIRNLREETLKGFYGRLKQGLLPMRAPLGYLDCGAGKPKEIDPVRGPLIREAFHLYASGRFDQVTLLKHLNQLGLRTKEGRPVTINTIGRIFKNPFYCGLIHIAKGNQIFSGIHKPLVSKATFDRVQQVRKGRLPRKERRWGTFLFSRMVRCSDCGRSLIGEVQKGYVYYRCHRRHGKTVCLREDLIDKEAFAALETIQLHPQENIILDRYVAQKRTGASTVQEESTNTIRLQLNAVNARLERLTDLLVDNQIDTGTFNERKKTLLSERLELQSNLQRITVDPTSALSNMEHYVELTKSLYSQYQSGVLQEKRLVLEKAMSNRSVDGKKIEFTLEKQLNQVAKRPQFSFGRPAREANRTFWKKWIDDLCDPNSNR